jgi:hypothetical protein
MPGTLDIPELLASMGEAAGGVLKNKWPGVRSFATLEFQKIAQTVAMIGEGVADGEITRDQATILLNMQKTASRAVIASSEGMGLIAAEQAINAALAAVKGPINAFVGFALL